MKLSRNSSTIILLVTTIIGFIPGLGIVEKILSIVSLWFVFQGWSWVLKGMEMKAERAEIKVKD